MSNFLDDMLMLAKMERGKLNLSRSPLFMERVLTNVREKFGPLAEAQRGDRSPFVPPTSPMP